MSLTSCSFLFSLWSTFHLFVQVSEAAVAMAKATSYQGNPNWCLDPSTEFGHKLGSDWSMEDQCGSASCEKRGNSLYISYSMCGQANVENPYALIEKVKIAYPYCCPEFLSAKDTSIQENLINTEDYFDLDMAASNSINHPVVFMESPTSIDSAYSHHPFQDKETQDLINIEDRQNPVIMSYDVDVSARESDYTEENFSPWFSLFDVLNLKME